MNVLVTGGAGYIGTSLIDRLIEEERIEKLIIYDNLSRNNYHFFLKKKMHNASRLQFIYGDLLDSRKLKAALEGVDVVYHLAAKVTTPFANTDPHFYEQINHWGTAELVYAVENTDVKKFIYTSSTSVYGASKEYLTEESTPNPHTFYGISKLRGEEHVRRLMDKMHTFILRCGNVYGFNRSLRFDAVINRFMFDANFQRRLSIHGRGKQSRAFISIDLIVNILCQIIFKEAASGTYNVVDRNLEILDIADTLKEIYPNLEFLFTNQHLDLRDLKVQRASKLYDKITVANPRTFKEELAVFKQHFSF